MRNYVHKPRRALLAAALAVGLGAGSAQGATINLDFGSVGNGSFSYDENSVIGNGAESIGISSFLFTLLGPPDSIFNTTSPGDYVFFNGGVFDGFQYTGDNGSNVLEFVSFGYDSITGSYGSLYVDKNPVTPDIYSSNFNPLPSGGGGGPAAVPEPETWLGSLLALGALAAARRRRGTGGEAVTSIPA